MPSFECHCGARYKFPESASGRRAKCRQCGTEFSLVPGGVGEIPVAPEDSEVVGPRTMMPTRAGEAVVDDDGTALAASRDIGIPRPIGVASGGGSPPLIDRDDPSKGYADSLLWTFLFPASPTNLVSFAVIWISLSCAHYLLVFAFVFALFLSIFISIWYSAFRFQVVESAACGDEDLPSVALGSDILSDYLAPFFRWIGSWLLVLVPAYVYTFVSLGQGSTTIRGALAGLLNGITGLLSALDADPILVFLFVLGLLFWPIVILCMALGGFTAAFRVDLLAATIVRTAGPYLITLVIVFGGIAAEYFIREAIAARLFLPAGTPIGGIISTAAIYGLALTGVKLYFDIVALRAIGLYYHHFKHRFAWSWE